MLESPQRPLLHGLGQADELLPHILLVADGHVAEGLTATLSGLGLRLRLGLWVGLGLGLVRVG